MGCVTRLWVELANEALHLFTIVEDPRYLDQPFITSTHFKREPDGVKWMPAPCEAGSPTSK